MDNDKPNWDFLGATTVPLKSRSVRNVGKLMKRCQSINFQPRMNKIDVVKTNHKRRYFEILDPTIREIFFHLMGCKTYLISQDKINVFKLMGCRFYVTNREI